MKIHEVKISPEGFDETRCGDKRFKIQIPKNDRGFQSGDILRFKEWDGKRKKYTGEKLDAFVEFIVYGKDEYGSPNYAFCHLMP